MKRRRPATSTADGAPPSPPSLSCPDMKRQSCSLTSLPLPLIREHVFSFVASPPLLSAEAFSVDAFDCQLAPLRCVSRQWKAIADSLWEQGQRITYKVVIETGDEDECRRHQEDAVRVGANARALEIVMGELSTPPTGPFVCTQFTTYSGSTFDAPMWTSFLSKFPRIERLDLSCVPFAMVVAILSTADAACPHVRALILPYSPSLEERNRDGYGTQETDVLITSLQTWRFHNGGLRLLHIPYWPAHHHAQVLEAIVTYCPGIWHLCGWHGESKEREVTALGTADTFLWAEFSRVCTELRAFDWRVASMWGTSVDAFRATSKPFLRDMIIHETRGRSNIDYALKSVLSIVHATPRLQRLEMQLQDRMFFLIAENHAAYADLETTIADAFVANVVATCPRLEWFHYRMRSSDREMTITDHAIAALLAVRTVHELVLTRVVFETPSLVSIVQRLVASRRRHWSVHLTAANAAHMSILSLLEYLGDHASEMENAEFRLVVAREDMVRNTYPRGIRVKDLVTETELQKHLTVIRANAPRSRRLDLALAVASFGAETQRHAICEMTLSIAAVTTDQTADVACRIARTHVPRYKRKAGRLA